MWENILNPERLSQVLQAQQERLSSQKKKAVSGRTEDISFRQKASFREAGSVCRRWENRECLRSQNISNLYWENLKISDLTEEPSGLQKENSTKRSRKRSTDRCTMAVIWLMRSGKRDRLCLKNRHFIWKRLIQENLRYRN